ncbi:MAG: Monosaccharide-transporting ATPase [Solirubrobacterales bacterium]|nr:Monosaccharide-transporting ATPase [Solirubrobacterales bacterium]
MSALHAAGISKTFGAVRVLEDAALTLQPGEIRALVGRNGSGKSTFIKILAGFHEPDPGGTLEVGGEAVDLPVRLGSAQRHGLSFVHQDLALVDEGSVVDNVLVGRFATAAGGRIPWRRERRRVAEALARFGVEADPRAAVSELGQVDRALVAIARSLLELPEAGGVLVLDEPTAFLPDEDVERLFAAVREVAATGTAVVYVSHRLDEVLALGHTVTVLRDGRVVSTEPTAGLPKERLVELILGQELEAFYPSLADAGSERVLEANGLRGAVVRDVSLWLAAGEIVGVTGLNGSGFDELPYLLFGAGDARAGTVTAGGTTRDAADLRPEVAIAAGLALLPGDRQRRSGVQDLRVRENVSLPALRQFFRGGRLRHGEERRAVRSVLERLTVTPPDDRLLLSQLSGGNQQKALLGKWLQLAPRVLLLHEPAQGVDVLAKRELFVQIEQAAQGGAAVLIASAEAEDLVHLCHRVLVLQDGQAAGQLAGGEISEERIAELSYRGDAGSSPIPTTTGVTT